MSLVLLLKQFVLPLNSLLQQLHIFSTEIIVGSDLLPPFITGRAFKKIQSSLAHTVKDGIKLGTFAAMP